MDAAAREVADHLAAKYGRPTADADMITDSVGAIADHRPGFLYSNADSATLADAETTTAYEARSKLMRERWKAPKPEDSSLPAPGEAEAAWHRKQALARQATKEIMGSGDAQQLADAAYAERNERLRNAWKHD